MDRGGLVVVLTGFKMQWDSINCAFSGTHLGVSALKYLRPFEARVMSMGAGGANFEFFD